VVVVVGATVVVELGGVVAESDPSERFAGDEWKLKTPASPSGCP